MKRAAKSSSRSRASATATKRVTKRPAAAKRAAAPAKKPSSAAPNKPAKAKPVKPPKPPKPGAAGDAKKYGRRGDLGAPIAGFFAKQPALLRALLEELRDLIEVAVPDAESSIKWGMPFFTINGNMMCALGGHKSHINLILSGSPSAYADPDKRLTGEAKSGRHLKLMPGDKVPREAVRGWLATAASLAREK